MAVGGLVLVKALIARVLFFLYSLLYLWRVLDKTVYAYLLLIPMLLLWLETYYTLNHAKHGEWKWFCPSVFLFLCSVVPAVWMLELGLNEEIMSVNVTMAELHATDIRQQIDSAESRLISVRVSPPAGDKVYEQILLLLLIIGRWLLPKDRIGRERLSQLLMSYIGMAADILELNEAFAEPAVVTKRFLVKIVLCCWSTGVFQYAFVLTTNKRSRTGLDFLCGPVLRTELWSILLSGFMQDIPFFTVRMYFIFGHGIVSELNIFFVCKNALVLMLQWYRIYTICHEKLWREKEEIELDKGRLRKITCENPGSLGNQGDPGDPSDRVNESR